MSLPVSRGGYACVHVVEQDADAHRYFTGRGTGYNLVCAACAARPDVFPDTLREVAPEEFDSLDWFVPERHVGQPEVFERPEPLTFVSRESGLRLPAGSALRSIVPLAQSASQWVALLDDGQLVQLDFAQSSPTPLAAVPADLPLADKMLLNVSDDGRFAIAAPLFGSRGVVIDLHSGTPTMLLDRGSYHVDVTPFSAAFARVDGRLVCVHATAWNRLNVSDPASGALLTARPAQGRGDAHDLDYFHGRLIPSPDGTWVAEDGWMWAPHGDVRSWSLSRWLHDNVWESEDGPTRQRLVERAYFWDGPLCWLDANTLAVWGFGNDDDFIMPAVQIFDVRSGERVRWFAGPRASQLFYDEYLFAVSETGTEVWDVNTGERLHHDAALVRLGFHPLSREFLSHTDGAFTLSRVTYNVSR